MLFLLAGCPTQVYEPAGEDVWKTFPFDGERTWTYRSTDTDVPYRLVATSTGEGEPVADGTGYRVSYDTDAGDPLFELVWSSDPVHGVRVHEIDGVVQDPPVLIADQPVEGDVATTDGGWTSAYHGIAECPIAMSASWPECEEIEVARSGADGGSLAGTWWAARGAGVAGFTPAGSAGQWQLEDYDCTGSCDGHW